MDKILQKKPQEICKDILTVVNNEDVNIEIDEKSKSSLYVFLTNTIYISNKTNKAKSEGDQKKSKVLVVAHECAHSIQSKTMQLINFILANLEIILFIVVILARVFFKKYDILVSSYVLISMMSILVRWYLEMNATINSVKLTIKYMLINKIDNMQIKELVGFYKKELLKTLPLFIISLFISKIARLIIVILIWYKIYWHIHVSGDICEV